MGTRQRLRATGRQSHGSLAEDLALLSVNGHLRSMYIDATTEKKRTAGYTAVEIGRPLMIRYLRIYLNDQKLKNKNELMISTFLNSQEQKNAAAEAINYFDNEAHSQGGVLAIRDFGGEKYGHPLIYYSKSYLGESLYFTIKIMELDSVRSPTKKAIQDGLSTLGRFPMFAEYLPFLAAARDRESAS